MSDLITYSKFYTQQDARLLTELLDANDVEYALEHEVNQLDNIYIGESLDPMFAVKILRYDFNRVSDLMSRQADEDFQQTDFSYYLDQYDTRELADILRNPNDWNAYDLRMAERLLGERIDYTPPPATTFANLYTPERIAMQWIIFGYIISFFAFFGIIVGLGITQARRTLKNGQTVKIYDAVTNAHGLRMTIIGVIMTILVVIARLKSLI